MSKLMRYIFLLFLLGLSKTRALPMTLASDTNKNNNRDEIFFVEKTVPYTNFTTNSTATLITFNGSNGGNGGNLAMAAVAVAAAAAAAVEEELLHDNESVLDTSAGASDDLIFIASKKQTHSQEQQMTYHNRSIHQIDLLTVDDIFPFSAESSSTSCEKEIVDDIAGTDAHGNASDETEVHADNLSSHQPSRLSIDMSDFVALIPADEIKSIVVNYYRNDPEVQRAYTYLSGREFAELKQRIIMIPEMSTFLRYLNASGLDVVGFLYTLTNLTRRPSNEQNAMDRSKVDALGTQSSGNELEKISLPVTATSTLDAALPTTMATTTLEITTTTSESLNGLHGLVDSILDILPQDQILSTFFDKLETNEQFSKLVDNIGSPDFAKIVYNMENSIPLRNLIFTLHNNGIYITRIVDSLKAYFFLGTF